MYQQPPPYQQPRAREGGATCLVIGLLGCGVVAVIATLLVMALVIIPVIAVSSIGPTAEPAPSPAGPPTESPLGGGPTYDPGIVESETGGSPSGIAAPPETVEPRTPPPTREGEPPYPDDPTWASLRSNPITALQVPAFPQGECTLPAEPDVPSSDPAAHQAYLQEMGRCLDRLWQPVIEQAGYEFVPITIVVGDPMSDQHGCTTPREGVAGYYCPVDHSLVISAEYDFGATGDDPADVDTDYLWVIAHEYAHHVQALFGIFRDVWTLQEADPSSWDTSHRLELQAICIGEMTLAQGTGDFALPPEDLAFQQSLEAYQSDDMHGAAASNLLWASRGLNSGGSTEVCNTFAAQPEDVA